MKTTLEASSGLPKHVAIVGRPNVGKSSLFNRIIRARKAIVYRETGTTRDRISQEVIFNTKRFILTDTGGFIQEGKGRLLKLIKEQIKKAISESDVLLFVCDGQAGPVSQDFELAPVLRKSNKKIFLVVNKVDNQKIEQGVLDFYQLGLDRPYAVSALHDIGIDELLHDVVKEFPAQGLEGKKAVPIRAAIIGRPNVGKSSFLNRLLKEERVLVDETPGTTRDTVDTCLKEGESEFILIDTAGLRHKRKITEAVDVYSIMRTKEAIKRSEVCLVLIDGYEGLRSDDLKILELVVREGKCCMLCVNKWDLVKGPTQAEYKEMIYKRANSLKKYPILFTSTKTGFNVYNSLGLIKEVIGNSKTKIPTPQLNRALNSSRLRGPLRIHYITQTGIQPPAFLIFVNDPRIALEEHKNFLENLLRRNFGFFGAPIQLKFRGSKGGKQ